MSETNEISVSNFLARTGRFAAKHPQLLRRLGNIETRWFKDDIRSIQIDRPVYIAGLARSGSTILLEILAKHAETATHRYGDFPFVHAPIWWNWFLDRASKNRTTPVERFHKDRILVTPQSPEAMEEILWMTFFNHLHDTAKNNTLSEASENSDFLSFYDDHIRKLLLLRKGTRYVAKNNYNISRLQYLRKLYPDALFVIPVRDPVEHVESLMKQHQLLLAEEAADTRVLDYMRQAGHYEFGADRRPINTNDSETCQSILGLWDKGDEVRGWARYWAALYGYVADLLQQDDKLRERTTVVHYDDLCSAPEQMLGKLYKHCALEYEKEVVAKQAERIGKPTYYESMLTKAERSVMGQECQATHSRIRAFCVGA